MYLRYNRLQVVLSGNHCSGIFSQGTDYSSVIDDVTETTTGIVIWAGIWGGSEDGDGRARAAL